jgi:Uma2 family endonuclease
MNPNLLEKTTSFVAEDQRITLYGVTWQQYEILRATLDDFAGLRMNYLKGTLEIFMPGAKHEQTKSVIGRLIETYSLETNTRLYACGSTTYRKQAEERGLEPDESYCIGELKEFPDLAIEVIVTSGSIDLLDIYIGLGVPEVWFWKNGKLSLYRLQAGQYEQIERSILLPNLDINLLVRCANMLDQHDAVIEFRNAIR